MPRDQDRHQRQRHRKPKLHNWMNNAVFARYWQHYYHAMGWYHKHMSMYYNTLPSLTLSYPHVCHRASSANPGHHECFSLLNHPPSVPHPVPPSVPHPTSHSDADTTTASQTECLSSELHEVRSTSDTGMKPRKRKKHRRWRKRHYAAENEKRQQEKQQIECDECVDGSESEIRMEITEDMLNFFAISENHRRQRDAVKASSETYVSVAQSDKKLGTVEPPMEQIGALRSREIKLLYGESAAMIHGMETALQMSYDRISDIHRPSLWPHLPLRILFA